VSPDEYRKLLRIGDNYFNTTTTLYRLGGATALGGFDAFLGSISDSFLSRQLAARYGFAFIPEVLGYWRFHGQNYSVATVTDPPALEELLVSLRAALAREPSGVFPSDYDDTLDRRVRFAGVRLIAMDHHSLAGARGEQIAAILHGGAPERRLLAVLMSMGLLGSIAALAWLTMRLRPLSLFSLLARLTTRRSILSASHPRWGASA
jgi:hypothetical protein